MSVSNNAALKTPQVVGRLPRKTKAGTEKSDNNNRYCFVDRYRIVEAPTWDAPRDATDPHFFALGDLKTGDHLVSYG